MATQFANGKIVTDGLVLALDAADRNSYASGSLVWNDVSGNGNSGSLINGPTFNSGSGGSIVFDGIDDYINCGTSNTLNLSADFTISSWIKVSYGVIVQRYFYGGSYPGYEISVGRSTTGKVDFFTGGTWYNNIGNSINNSNWINMVFTVSGTSATYYQNLSQSLFTVVASTSNLNDTFYIGTTEGTTSYLLGNLSILQIYNKALSAQEVLQNYNAQKSRFGLK